MLDKISQALALTQQMLAATEHQHWDEVEKLQLARQRLIKQSEALPTPTDQATSEQISQQITAMQTLNDQIAPLLEQRRQTLIKEKLQTNKGQKMNKAYKST
ncbi:flagellar protein FliT [Amphritea sp. 2_MG-2023]|uniref:flagellar protein FliT n=1 Tax=Amphritea TaxID=515417 RepID=UPI001C06C6A0|nr:MULTISPECIES: flagellar protein FliT [Amphritea]MBU2964838.1 flagellar protein FliT [Amphritea atlantica]MDO6419587.1 flagellar protein FliT [Amphritea sp. 2_MG-2023]